MKEEKVEKKMTNKEIVKMLLNNRDVDGDSEEELMEILIDNHIAVDVDKEDAKNKKFGDRVADKVTQVAGSWAFILSFISFLVIWILLNLSYFENLDPYPFILLNLILSCIAALQAPVIMMSQNRQETKDRERSRKDYMINLKSELEIRTLHEKIDHFVMSQQQELIELQKTEIDMLKEILKQLETKQDK